MAITVDDGTTTYTLDGEELFTNGSRYSPRGPMTVNFNSWFIDLPFEGKRSWEMKVDWVYHQAGEVASAKDIEKAMAGFRNGGTHYVNTLPSE